eukprot:10544484-Alexandrium_andersonii.AAC.1
MAPPRGRSRSPSTPVRTARASSAASAPRLACASRARSRRPQKWTPSSRLRGKQHMASHSTASPVPSSAIVPPQRHPQRMGSELRPCSPTGAMGSPAYGAGGSVRSTRR